MPDEETKKLQEKARGFINNPIKPFLEEAKLTEKYAVRKLKAELRAKEVKTIKIKGAVNPNDLPRGFKVIATTGVVEKDKKGNRWYSNGETVIEYNPAAGGIRQNARQDLIMYLGLKPADKHMFPDKEGEPQDISVLPGLEVANRLAFLLEQALKRKEEDDRTSSPEDK